MNNKKGLIISAAALVVIMAVMAVVYWQFGPENVYEKDNSSQTESPDTEVAAKKISVEIVFQDGTSKTVEINTNAESLRKALEEKNLIEGEESEFGLMVKSVDGVVADYDKDKSYWAFSKNGEYLMTGVDQTPVADGDSFTITYTIDTLS